jgi:hypothetical protein
MPLIDKNKIHDDLPDEISECLRKLNTHLRWTKEKHRIFADFESLAKRKKYIFFTGDFRDYHLERKGEHCLYDVPFNQKGALKVFSGKRIRLVCGSKSNQREGRFFYAKNI